MKKKKKNRIETAVEVINNLKATEVISQEKGQNASTIKTLEASVRKIEKLKNEVLALKEKLKNRKVVINQEKELMWELVKEAKKLLKNNPQKKVESEKKGKKPKVEKAVKIEKTE